MQPFMDLEDYIKSNYRLFGKFPALLMFIGVVLAYVTGIILTAMGIGDMVDPYGFEGFANGLFRGVVAGVAVFYGSRIMSENSIKKAYQLVDREPEGIFIPCMSHKTTFDFGYGSIVIKEERLYFEPYRAFTGDRSFDYSDFSGFRFELTPAMKSIGLFIITGEKHMLAVVDGQGNTIGTFIIPQPEVNLPLIQPLLEANEIIEGVQE